MDPYAMSPDDVRAPMPIVVLPWHLVKHDNHRLLPVLRKGRPTLITAPEYRQAKESAELSIKHQWRANVKLSGSLALHARCFFPDARKRDAGNYRKLITDAMSEICYDDDAQLHSETWEHAGIDRANPRVEVTLSTTNNQEK